MKRRRSRPRRLLLLHGLLFLAGLLAVMKALDWRLVLGITVLALLLLDRRGFRGADYGLLASFVCFFVLVGNLARLPAVSGLVSRLLEGRVMAVSALLSQIISNVPAAAMLASFTEDWQGLLLGVNIGGLGTLIASHGQPYLLPAVLPVRRPGPGPVSGGFQRHKFRPSGPSAGRRRDPAGSVRAGPANRAQNRGFRRPPGR